MRNKVLNIMLSMLLVTGVSAAFVNAKNDSTVYSTLDHSTPYLPSNPDPENGSTNVNVSITLSWDGGDPDVGETVYYDIYLSEEPNPGFVERIGPFPADQIRITYNNLSRLVYNTRYYWRIDAIDSYGYTTTGPTWTFETKDDRTPYLPSNPFPENNSEDVPLNVTLSWTGGDPDEGDVVYYDVYLGTEINPPNVAWHQLETSYGPVNLSPDTTYYWRVDAFDDYGYTTTGPTWVFKTKNAPVFEVRGINGGLGKIKVSIKNVGTMDAFNVDYSIKLENGWVISGKDSSGTISSLAAGEETVVYSDFIVGFGKTVVTVTVKTMETPVVSKTVDALVLLFYVLII